MSGSKMAGKQRMFNMHPTQAFVGHHHGQIIIHQPKKGRWEMKTERVKNPKSPRGYSITNVLKCVDPDKVVPNYVDVPTAYAKLVTEDGLGQGRLQPSKNDQGEVDHYHHGGFLKTQDEVDAIHVNEFAEKEARLAELEAKILEKQKTLASIEADTVAKAPKRTERV